MKFSLITIFALAAVGMAAPAELSKRACKGGDPVSACCGDKHPGCKSYDNCLLRCNPTNGGSSSGAGGVFGCILACGQICPKKPQC
ncbi:hypothetical protein DE146DRAFT_792700 [Phaeosphaeria sp. MPI-PUGE-AT-0046c]|nr:hypothetical protein DE146DRAFT_792700 [Phaeosphaeria sp. MPI-PUGE-AT-0046c]